MYNVSNAFHAAVAAGNEQKALLIFSNCFFSDEDIAVDRGIVMNDNFNMEEDLAIGQATSNEISFSLLNDDRLLNSFTFGEFKALIGVSIGSTAYTPSSGENVRVVAGNTYTGFETYPYIKRNNTALSSQPAYAVRSILVYNGKVYCFDCNGHYTVYDDATGSNITSSNAVHDFIVAKSHRWVRKGMYYVPSTRLLKIWKNSNVETFEFCPLGTFIAKRPKAPDVIQIDMNCYDLMTKFDKDVSEVSITFPITISNLFVRLCTEAGVEYVLPETFINGSAVINSRPKDFDNATMRDVLKWIAEAACSNARFNRDGKLILDWIRNGTGQVLGTGNYSEFTPYWYETKQVTRLYNRDTQGSSQTTYGSGAEGYLIQDNPLLRGVG